MDPLLLGARQISQDLDGVVAVGSTQRPNLLLVGFNHVVDVDLLECQPIDAADVNLGAGQGPQPREARGDNVLPTRVSRVGRTPFELDRIAEIVVHVAENLHLGDSWPARRASASGAVSVGWSGA